MELLLIRHAASSGQAPDAPLAVEGAAQARDLVPVLQGYGPTRLFSSPYVRAQATLAPFAKASGMAIELLPQMAERQLADRPLPDWRDHIARSYADRAYAPAGGESLDTVAARAAQALAVMAQAGGKPVAVGHGQWISAVFSQIDPGFGFEDWATLRNPDLFLVTLDATGACAFRRWEA